MGVDFLNASWRTDFWISAFFLSATTIAVALRAYVRYFIVNGFGADDWVLILSQFFSIGSTVAQLIFAGTPIRNVPDLRTHINLYITCGSLYIVTLLLLKASLTLFYLRFLISRWQRMVAWSTLIIFALIAIPTIFVTIFYCGDPAHLLANYLSHKCLSWSVTGGLHYTYGVLDVLSNWVLALLPVTVIKNTSMPRGHKISASILVGLGAITSIISLIRLAYIHEISLDSLNSTTGGDPYQNIFPASTITIISVVECTVASLAASAATLRPLFRKLRGRVAEHTDHGKAASPDDMRFMKLKEGGRLGRHATDLSETLREKNSIESKIEASRACESDTEDKPAILVSTTIQSTTADSIDETDLGVRPGSHRFSRDWRISSSWMKASGNLPMF